MSIAYRVRNLQEGRRSSNWIKYWEDVTGLKANTCHKVGCLAKTDDGAHVRLVDSTNRKWYMFLCATLATANVVLIFRL
jgi:hypothetical protein